VPLFSELHRITRPGGRLVVSDVAQGSRVAGFLDGYVGAHNSTGHEGIFLGQQTRHELTAAGWNVRQAVFRDFHWVFQDRQGMAAFCHRLFDIRRATEADTLRAIETQLGVTPLPNGGVGLCWSLLTFTCDKP
jgi:SAM-dependent methyltransferase